MFDANSDTYSQFFMDYSCLIINNDSTDSERFLRARYIVNLEWTTPTNLITKVASDQPLSDNRVTVARFKELQVMSQLMIMKHIMEQQQEVSWCRLTEVSQPMELTPKPTLNWARNDKSYLMFNGAKTSNHVSSGDAYNSESDGEENYKQYHIHGRVGNRFSDNSDYLEEFARNNPSNLWYKADAGRTGLLLFQKERWTDLIDVIVKVTIGKHCEWIHNRDIDKV